MAKRRSPDIIHRWEGNPSIMLEDLSFQCADISNAGAIKIDGQYILLVTIQNLKGHYSIYAARSDDGYYFNVSDKPLIAPLDNDEYSVYEEDGVLDPRVVTLEDTNYICYHALSRHGFRVGLAKTTNFETVQRLGLMSEPDTKAAALFPVKIKGKYARLERPGEGSSIWVSYSDDLEYWGWNEVVMTPRGGYWDCNRIGTATPPMKIYQGWLIIYYGVKETSAGPLFRLGAAILDADNPARVVGRTNVPILSPREDYERIGDVQNLVYSCGAIIEADNQLKLYYGAANSCICLGTTALTKLVEECLHGDRGY
jgi:predicted GH43/DUF377 family glycosyl hydrolase